MAIKDTLTCKPCLWIVAFRISVQDRLGKSKLNGVCIWDNSLKKPPNSPDPNLAFLFSSLVWVSLWLWQQGSEKIRRDNLKWSGKSYTHSLKKAIKMPQQMTLRLDYNHPTFQCDMCMSVCVALLIGLWLVLSENQLLHWRDWKYYFYALSSHSGHSFSSSLFQELLASPWQFTWPHIYPMNFC